MTTETVKHIDIQCVQIKESVWVVPQSTLGMLWLQLHFSDRDWDALSKDAIVLPLRDAHMLVVDAKTAELVVDYHF